MGSKSQPSQPQIQQVAAPSPEQIAEAQVKAARGILDLQLEKYPAFTAADIERMRAIAPEAAQAVVDAQNVVLQNVQAQFPQFFEVLQGLGTEALSRLSNIGQIPQDVATQAIELSRADQAQRGIVDSPLGVAGTAGQLALLGQQQRGQDISLASGFLNLPFAPNLPLTGVPGAGQITQSGSQAAPIPSFGDLTSAFGLQADIGFSNAALQRSNALLGGGAGSSGGGGFNWGGAATGAISGAQMGSAAGPWGAGAGAIIGGALGGFF